MPYPPLVAAGLCCRYSIVDYQPLFSHGPSPLSSNRLFSRCSVAGCSVAIQSVMRRSVVQLGGIRRVTLLAPAALSQTPPKQADRCTVQRVVGKEQFWVTCKNHRDVWTRRGNKTNKQAVPKPN
eukprot:gene11858-biopygen362